MTLGFVSGKMDETFLPRLVFFKSLGCNALELHPNLDRLKNIELSAETIRAILSFDYISLHAPAGNFVYDTSPESARILSKIDQWVTNLSLRLVVVHPDRVHDNKVLQNRNWPLALENMDRRKNDGQTVAQMKTWLDKFPQASMVLDINHAFTLDKSMQLASDLYANFSSRIREIHFSGYTDEEQIHEPITISHCEYLLKYIPDKTLPIIIEIFVNNLSDEVLRKEFETIRDYLSR